MHIVFRTDASSLIGTGHLMRCLTFAKLLNELASSITFICREYDGNIYDLVEKQGFTVYKLPIKTSGRNTNDSDSCGESLSGMRWQDDANKTIDVINFMEIKPDWLIVDHYEFDEGWENALQDSTENIMVIDDLADRAHNCDLLLDQNYYVNMESRYERLVPTRCQKFLGPQYLLLRNEFERALTKQEKRTGAVERIIMFFGGSDASHETLKALEALSFLKENHIRVDVVVGQSNADHKKIKRIVENMPAVTFHYQINNMAELMIQADLAVIAAGGSTWEACYLSLPAITIMTAENQFEAISSLGNEGVLWNLGWFYEVASQDIADAIEEACLSPDKLIDMGKRAKQLVGSSSGLKKILDTMKDYKIS